MTIDYFQFRSTRCFAVASWMADSYLAVDACWPGSMDEYRKGLKSRGIRFDSLKWAMVTHFHMDHAGLIGAFQRSGIECYVFEGQEGAIEDMERIIGRHGMEYEPIDRSKLKPWACSRSRELFASMGIEGETIPARGHSTDSVAFLQGEDAIIGDLAHIDHVDEDDEASQACWRELKQRGVRRAYPSHAAIFEF
jgi:endoribonuclease LACTB2